MRKLLVIAAAATATLLAPPADAAQGRGEGRWRERGDAVQSERRGPRWDRDRGDRERGYRDRAPRIDRGWRDDGPPSGGRWGRGQYLPPPMRRGQVEDFRQHRLRPPPMGYDWVRVGPDIYLMQRSTGLVVEAIPNGY